MQSPASRPPQPCANIPALQLAHGSQVPSLVPKQPTRYSPAPHASHGTHPPSAGSASITY
eukprot:1905619-Rhodomonas_salina.3